MFNNKKDTIIAVSSCLYQRLGLCHYFKALKLLFEYFFYYIYTCLRKFNFLIAFPFPYLCYLLFISFLFIIVFYVIYMLLPLYVLCSKIAIKKILFILKSREILRDFLCSQSGLWLKICWCVVCCLCHAAHHTL